jgi:hypothetical protein
LLLLQALLTALAANGGSRDVHSAIEAALPVLLERLADNNARLRDSARDALVALAQVGVCVVHRASSSAICFAAAAAAAPCLRDSALDALVALAQVGVCFCTQHGKQQRILFCGSSSSSAMFEGQRT